MSIHTEVGPGSRVPSACTAMALTPPVMVGAKPLSRLPGVVASAGAAAINSRTRVMKIE